MSETMPDPDDLFVPATPVDDLAEVAHARISMAYAAEQLDRMGDVFATMGYHEVVGILRRRAEELRNGGAA